MTDGEKVIKRLEECLSASCRGFRTCPYSDDEWDAVESALALLKKQEAVKPQLSISGMWYECPICHRHLTKDRDNYCARCGRSVKWND